MCHLALIQRASLHSRTGMGPNPRVLLVVLAPVVHDRGNALLQATVTRNGV